MLDNLLNVLTIIAWSFFGVFLVVYILRAFQRGGIQEAINAFFTGRVIIPLAHKPFPIGPSERDQWLLCMHGALEETSLDAARMARLMESCGRMAEMCRTKD